MAITTATPVVTSLPNKGLVSTKTFDRVSKRIMKDHGLPPEVAERVLDAALGFIQLAGNADEPLAPSQLVDIGWHTFLLYTPEYMGFCREHVGHFVHHVPNDDPDAPHTGGGSHDTVRYMQAREVEFDHMLWGVNEDGSLCVTTPRPSGSCSSDVPIMRLCGVEIGRGPGCSNVHMHAPKCKNCEGVTVTEMAAECTSDCDQDKGGGGSGWDGCKGQPK